VSGGARVRLGVAVAFCLALLACVLAEPLSVRATVRAYAQASDDEPALRRAVLAKGERAVPTLIQHALDPACPSRGRIVALLRELDPEQARDAFVKALKEFRPERRACAAEALELHEGAPIPGSRSEG